MISRTFDLESKQLQAQVAKFEREVKALEKAVAPMMLLTGTREDGRFVHVTVLAALPAAVVDERGLVQ